MHPAIAIATASVPSSIPATCAIATPLPTSWDQSPSETDNRLSRHDTQAFYATQKFTVGFTRISHLILSLASWIQSVSSYHSSLWSTLISAFHLCLDLITESLQVFLTENFSHFSTPPLRATCSSHLIILDLTPLITLKNKVMTYHKVKVTFSNCYADCKFEHRNIHV
jgi:hypothetical protein